MNKKSRTGKFASASEMVRARTGRILRQAWSRLFSLGGGCPRIGLALSSGGAKSLAHVGVIQVLEENGIPIHAVAGSSMGAYVGALWASGIRGQELEALAAEMHDKATLKRLADPAFPFLKGLVKGDKAKRHLGRSIGDVTFGELDKELIVIAADLDSYERIVFCKGKVLDAVHASCAIPGIVVPVEIDGRRCVDGGVADPVPVAALRKFCEVDYVIAVSTLPSFGELNCVKTDTDPMFEPELPHGWWGNTKQYINRRVNLAAEGNAIDTLRRGIRIAQIRLAYDSCKRADVVIHAHSCQKSRWHDYHNYRHFVDLGRAVAEQELSKIQELVGELNLPACNDEKQTEQMVG